MTKKREQIIKDVVNFIDAEIEEKLESQPLEKYDKLLSNVKWFIDDLRDNLRDCKEVLEEFKSNGSTLNQLESEGYLRGITDAINCFKSNVDIEEDN